MAMDYEFSIRVLEKELAHQREMQALLRAHVDAHDRTFDMVASSLQRAVSNLEKTNEALSQLATAYAQLAAAQAVSEQKFQGLVDLLTREHNNGKK